MRVRTVPKAVKEIKAADPNSFVNEKMLREFIKAGYIKRIECGYKYFLVDLDELERFLEGGGVRDC